MPVCVRERKWCPGEDSNPQRLPSEGSASAGWATGTGAFSGKVEAGFPQKMRPVHASHGWCPCEESNPALPLTRRLHRRQCFKGGASRRNQTSVSSLRGTCSVTELCRHVIDCMKIDKWTGVLLRIPRREAGAQCRVQFIWTFTMSNNSILADRILVSGKAPPCRARMRTRLSRRRGSCTRMSCEQHERRHDCSGVSCDNLGRSCPPACLAEGFSALPPVNPVLLTLVWVYSSVG